MDTHVADPHSADATRDLGITRRIPAAPAEVFAAWTQPERIKAWWGPNGMTTPEAEVDLRPGGIHRTVMRDATGKDHPSLCVIDEVAAPHRLVIRVPPEAGGPLVGATATITFAEDGGGTWLDVLWRHPSPEMRAAHEAMGFTRGWGETLDRLTAHAAAAPPDAACPMATRPGTEHGWLHRMLGEWSYESECDGPPGQPPMRATGVERVRSLGGYWVIGEAEGEMPGGGPARWIMTVGFDARTGRFRGTWVGSMMGHMFLYDGALSEDGRTLALESEGPSFTGEGTSRYRDVMEMLDDDTRLLTSHVQGEDGGWTGFMRATFRRTA
jgi:uncharacterized protein YndB with AHSA1/START domain